ncbi:MAG: tol-pal system YbgF family protein, partial [Muribaculaceae bacterium]
EKMQKAIQLHSIKKRPKKNSGKMRDPKYREYLKRDEYNPFLHKAWYLMAKAQYMNGDFLGAATTFHYITRHFTWLDNLVLEAKLWEARCYCGEGWLSEAENILVRIKPDELRTKEQKKLFNLAYADYHVKNKQGKEAIPYVAESARQSKGGQKTRLNFLLGQLYAADGQRELAYKAFADAGSASNATYRTKFNARIKQSEVFTGTNVEKEVKALKRMVRFDRNKEYLDQVYYAIGNLYLQRADTVNAIANYKLAAEKSTRNGIEKAISQITLGSLYFDMHNYDDAQPCYAEAVPLLNEEYPNYEMLKRRSDVLDELAVYSQNAKLQDSLLQLSMLSEEKQHEVAQRLVDELKKKEKEEAEAAAREEYLAEQRANAQQNNPRGAKAPASYSINNDNSWYFYNTATKNAGKTEFQKLWGNRKLEDDWRRRNKNTFAMSDFDADAMAETDSADVANAAGGAPAANDSVDAEAQKRADDPHFVEYYLKQIPKSDEERQTCRDIIQEGLFNMGLILKDKLEDFPASIDEFNILLKDYPDNIYRLDVYYNMYLIYMRTGNTAMAERMRQLILSDFADSNYGLAMRDPNYIENLRNMDREQEGMYENAYAAYLDNDNSKVHEAYAEMMRKYPLSKIMPKFMFIDALAYLTDKDYDAFKSSLRELLERYPDTDITPTASSILSQIAKGRKLEGGSANVRGMIWDMRLSNDTTEISGEAKLTPFDLAKNSPQYFVLAFDTDSTSMNQLLFDVAKHNFTSFVVRDFDIEPMNFGRLGLIVVKGFANFNELAHYRNVFEADEALKLDDNVRIVLISEDNFKILVNEGRSLEEYFNFMENSAAEATENAALESADESESTEEEPTESTEEEPTESTEEEPTENTEEEPTENTEEESTENTESQQSTAP